MSLSSLEVAAIAKVLIQNDLTEAEALATRVLGWFLRGKPTSIGVMNGEEGYTCECKIHQKVVCGQLQGTGCVAGERGTLGPLLELYRSGRESANCHNSESAAKGDKSLVEVLMSDVELIKMWCRPSVGMKRWITCRPTTVADWGAGYCYLHLFDPFVRYRAARILGPNCDIIDLIRVICVVGADRVYGLVPSANINGLHFDIDHGRGKSFSHIAVLTMLMRIVDDVGVHVRVGVRQDEVGFLKVPHDFPKVFGSGKVPSCEFEEGVYKGVAVASYLAKRGFDMSGVSRDDWAVVGSVAATLPLNLPFDGKQRLKGLALLGDRIMKVVIARRGYFDAMTVEAIARLETLHQTNANLADKGMKSGLLLCVDSGGVDVAGARVGGTAFEAIVGLVFLVGGEALVIDFMIDQDVF